MNEPLAALERIFALDSHRGVTVIRSTPGYLAAVVLRELKAQGYEVRAEAASLDGEDADHFPGCPRLLPCRCAGTTMKPAAPPPLDGLRETLRWAAQDFHEAAMALRSGFSVHDGPDFEKCPDIRCGQFRAALGDEGETT